MQTATLSMFATFCCLAACTAQDPNDTLEQSAFARPRPLSDSATDQSQSKGTPQPVAPPAPPAPPSAPAALFVDQFMQPDGLITNEFAVRWPDDATAIRSPSWDVTSGSVFAQNGTAWTGIPDGDRPNVNSSNATDSAVFRMNTKRADFGDVAVTFALKNNGLTTTSRTPAHDYDGVHVWLRHVSETSLYAASIHRRDNVAFIKKKVPGGTQNGGTYYDLALGKYTVPYNTWQQISATVKNNADGSVTITLSADGKLVLSATDKGVGGPPIRTASSVGVRGDNCNFNFDDFTVSPR